MENNFKFKVGDEVEVVRLNEDFEEDKYFDIGFRGIVSDNERDDYGNAYCVEFSSTNNSWWASESSLELVSKSKTTTPTTTRGFLSISISEWLKNIPTDVDKLQWEQLYHDIKKPVRGTRHSAGYDFFSPFTFTLEPNEDIKIPTGICSYMLEDEVLFIHTRSSLGFKYYSRLANVTGVVDCDYFGNENNEGHVFIKIRNEGTKSMTINKGEAFAQGIFQKYLLVDGDSCEIGKDRVGGIGSTN